VTLDIYGHLPPGTQEKAASVMDDLTTPVVIFTENTAPKMTQFVKVHKKDPSS